MQFYNTIMDMQGTRSVILEEVLPGIYWKTTER
jgi:hypothetical protein